MNSDELKGKLENLKGRAKEALGSFSGNKKQEAEGLAERVEGAGREKFGEAREAISSTSRERKAEREDIEETDDE